MTRIHCVAFVAALLILSPTAAKAALLAYDGFNYAPAGSDVLGQSGGAGFGASWLAGGFNASEHANYDVQSGSLTFGNLLTGGNRSQTSATASIAGLTRDLLTPLGTAGTTRYVSFLARPEVTLDAGAFNGFLGLALEQSGEPELFIGKPGGGTTDRYVLEDRGGAAQVSSSVAPVLDQTALLVVKAEFMAGADQFTLYVNPVPGAAEPATGIVKNDSDAGTVSGLTIYSTGAFSMDEIRVGETFADVTPVIEPVHGTQVVSNLSNDYEVGFGIQTPANATAGSFTTGADPYTLDAISVALHSDSVGDTSTMLLRADSSGSPGAVLETLGTKSLPVGDSLLQFFSVGTPLSSNSTYWVTLGEAGSGFGQWQGTDSTLEVSPVHWTIGDQTFQSQDQGASWRQASFGPPNSAPLFAVKAALTGDANADGKVNLTDFGILKEHFGALGTRSQGDFNGDGKIDLADFGLLKTNFGKSAAAAPEPTARVLAIVGGAFLFGLLRLGRPPKRLEAIDRPSSAATGLRPTACVRPLRRRPGSRRGAAGKRTPRRSASGTEFAPRCATTVLSCAPHSSSTAIFPNSYLHNAGTGIRSVEWLRRNL